MTVTSLTLDSLSTPIDVTTAETASVSFTLSGTESARFGVYAVPDGGGTPILLGQTGVFNGAGGYPGNIVNLDSSLLNPSVNYTFYAQQNFGGTFQSANTIGPLDVTCFASGTLILTARGEVPVEDLRVGDLVVTAQGTGAPLQPITWIGRLNVAVQRQRDRAKVAPVLIKADALADGVPHRDLRVSPEHALFIDGRLVPAGLLVNGSSIVQELWCPEVTYWHVELPAHGLLVAEGAHAESYFDDGNRHLFDNGGVVALFASMVLTREGGRYEAEACAPVLREGTRLEAIRARIALRSRAAAIARAG